MSSPRTSLLPATWVLAAAVLACACSDADATPADADAAAPHDTGVSAESTLADADASADLAPALEVGQRHDSSPGPFDDDASIDRGLPHDSGVDEAPKADADSDSDVAPRSPRFPRVPNHGGPVLSTVEIVPIFYAADPLRSSLEPFNDWVLTSEYWAGIGREYGVGPGVMHAPVIIPTPPPTTISGSEIEGWLGAAQGTTLPEPNGNTVYVVFYPDSTSVVRGSTKSCDDFFGYHGAVPTLGDASGSEVAYAVVPRCGDPRDHLAITTNTASHEYLESAVDPFPSSRPAWTLTDLSPSSPDPWGLIGGYELIDLCTNEPYARIDGFRVQHAWSNAAAAAQLNPCQPSDPAKPYFVLFTEENSYHAQAGAPLVLRARAWANGPAPTWRVGINTAWTPSSDFDGQATLDHTSVNVGDQVLITVTVPAPSDAGTKVYNFTIDSLDPDNRDFYHPWPITVIVE